VRLLLVVCLSLVLAPLQLFASTSQPGRLSGRIVDQTGAPLASARVIVKTVGTDAVRQVTTDSDGRFTLDLEPGEYSVLVSADGFQQAERRITIGTLAPPALDLVLPVAGLSEAVSVEGAHGYRASEASALKTGTALLDVPQAISVVTRDLMTDQRISSMADVVRFMPGIGMAQGEGNRDTPVFRGNSSTSDFYIDGVRDDVQYFRDVYNVDRVEGLKGPSALLFGRGGAGGVLNRVTRQADWSRAREVSLQAGSFGNRRMTADVGDRLNQRATLRVTGVYEDSDSYRDHVSNERYGIQPSFGVRLAPSTTLRASYERFHDERTADRGVPSYQGRPLDTPSELFFGDPGKSPVDATVDAFGSVLEHQGASFTVRNRFSYAVYDKFYQNIFPGAVNAAGTMVSLSAYNNATTRDNLFNQTDVVVSATTGAIGHRLLAGFEAGRQDTDNFRSTGYFTAVGPSVTSLSVPVDAPTVSVPVEFRQSATDADNHSVATTAAFYAQDQVAITSRFQVVGGVRLELFDVDFTNNRTGARLESTDTLVSPRAGMIYKVRPDVSLYGSYSLTRLPRAGEQLSSLTVTNQALEPEEFRNYEAGVKWELTPGFAISGAAYRLDRGNVIVPDPADPTLSLLVDAQRTRGVELDATGAITSKLFVVAGYAWQDGEITRDLSATVKAGATLAHLPRHSASLWTKYQFAPRWAAAAGIVYREDIFASTDNLVSVPAYTRVDGALFWDVSSKLRLQVNAENLLNESYWVSAHSNNNITPGSPRAARVTLITRF
jgi:catecholate siderophore receptor